MSVGTKGVFRWPAILFTILTVGSGIGLVLWGRALAALRGLDCHPVGLFAETAACRTPAICLYSGSALVLFGITRLVAGLMKKRATS